MLLASFTFEKFLPCELLYGGSIELFWPFSLYSGSGFLLPTNVLLFLGTFAASFVILIYLMFLSLGSSSTLTTELSLLDFCSFIVDRLLLSSSIDSDRSRWSPFCSFYPFWLLFLSSNSYSTLEVSCEFFLIIIFMSLSSNFEVI